MGTDTRITDTRITDKQARGGIAAPRRGYVLIGDGATRGLGLRITAPTRSEPDGARAWVFTYRVKTSGRAAKAADGDKPAKAAVPNKQRRMTIGRVQDWPVAKAREYATELRRIVDAGGDPLKARQDEREAETVDDLADRYVEEHLPTLRATSQEGASILLRKWIRPELGALKVKAVEYRDVAALHRKITKAGTPYTANRAVALCSKMFSLAIRWKMRADNPAKGVERNHEDQRQRFLDGDELGRLMKALANHAGKPSADAVRLLLLTGARRSEVLGATYDQFNLKDGVWTKPSSHTKQKKEHRVPLSAPARQLVADMLARENAAAEEEGREPSAMLFPGHGTKGAQRQLKGFWRTVCGEAGLAERVPVKLRGGKIAFNKKGEPRMTWRPTVRVHDLRHSYASTLAGAGLSLPIIGALLGHTQAQTTARYAHLADAALRAATERVGAEVTAAEKKQPDNVVDLRGGAR